MEKISIVRALTGKEEIELGDSDYAIYITLKELIEVIEKLNRRLAQIKL